MCLQITDFAVLPVLRQLGKAAGNRRNQLHIARKFDAWQEACTESQLLLDDHDAPASESLSLRRTRQISPRYTTSPE